MQLYNALDLKSGKKSDYNKLGTLMQPVQMLSQKEKDEEWCALNMDWHEWQGLRQIRRNAKRLLKNYKLAMGVIDRSDYIVEENPEEADIIDTLMDTKDDSAMDLKFYPIIPNVVNVLCNEFSKRVSKVMYQAVDEMSYNEMLEAKRQQVEDVLMQQAQAKILTKLIAMGMDPQGEEAQQQLAPENLKTLPEIQAFFDKSYRSEQEEWATHQHQVDVERFRMVELEERAFRDMLITDREFWHFRMLEDDYEIELWNPLLTFYHKSPSVRYISQGNYVGKIDLMSLPDIIDTYGWMMDDDQLEQLESMYPVRAAGYAIPGLQNDGSYYDSTKSHEWNTQMPSLAYRQFTSLYDNQAVNGDIIQAILNESEDFSDFGSRHLLRATTLYWKTHRKIGHLTKITETGEMIQDIIDESYKITDKPMYDTSIYKVKTKDTLVFGEHIDWIWFNEIWGGIKIGPNRPSFWGMKNSPGGFNPLYIGLNGGKIGRLPFQFKGEQSVYGCKLPVEGAVFNDRNTRSQALVDLMKPYQIGHNIVNNQIADILVDELGTVIMLDQNALPKHSMGEDWGKSNLSKAYVAMKNFQMLPLDTSISNMDNPTNFQHYQVLNLEQTQRLLSRVQLATYFKNEAMAVIGINPERMGQSISQATATGVEQAVQSSYAQTEQYFIQHSDYLMPRVHEMRTNLAQYYQSNNPSVRLQYLTQESEKVNFAINGTKLLLRDFNVFCTTKNSSRAVMEQLRGAFLNNNTTGASIYDLGNVIKAESIAEITRAMKAAEEKQRQQQEAEQQHEQQMQEAQQASQERQQQLLLEHQDMQAEKERQKDILIAQIMAAGRQNTDYDANAQSDYLDAMERIQQQGNYVDQMNLKREQESNKVQLQRESNNLKRQELSTRERIAQQQLEIAKENKTNAEVAAQKKARAAQKKK